MEPLDRFTCEDVFRRLDDFLDRELGEDETRRVLEHLETCRQCTEEAAFTRGVLDDLRAKVRRIRAPGGLLDDVRRKLEEGSGESG